MVVINGNLSNNYISNSKTKLTVKSLAASIAVYANCLSIGQHDLTFLADNTSTAIRYPTMALRDVELIAVFMLLSLCLYNYTNKIQIF